MNLASTRMKRYVFGYLLILPAFILMVIFFVWPFIHGFLSSLYKGIGFKGEFAGFENYIKTFNDPRFWNSLKVSVIFTTLFIIISCGLAFILSLIFVKKPKGYIFFLTVAFIPYISTPVIGALVWLNILGEPFGIINVALSGLGFNPVPFLKNPGIALLSLVFIQVWYTLGYNTILFLAGLQAIPVSYFESAEIEGCSFFQRLIHIAFPLLIPTIVFVAIVSIMYGFINSYVLAKLVTGGGPFEATNVMMAYIFELGFDRFQLGRANAVTLIMFAVFFFIAFFQFNYQRKRFFGLH